MGKNIASSCHGFQRVYTTNQHGHKVNNAMCSVVVYYNVCVVGPYLTVVVGNTAAHFDPVNGELGPTGARFLVTHAQMAGQWSTEHLDEYTGGRRSVGHTAAGSSSPSCHRM